MHRRDVLGLAVGTVITGSASRALAEDLPKEAWLRFDSRSPQHKKPFGAVPERTDVEFAVEAGSAIDALTLVIEQRRLEGNQDVLEYTEVARLPMKREGVRWIARHRFDAPAVYGYYFEAIASGQPIVHHNNTDEIPWTREKGSNGAGVTELKPAKPEDIRRFRHTVFRRDFKVPDWAKDAIYYYIFPERFRNGDKRNDPKPGIDTYQDQGVELHARWNEKPYKPGTGDGSDAVYNNDFFGGDIAGIIEKLDYIAELGANTLYITPMFRASSNHKYDTADYKHIDPHFGTDEDFTRLCKEAAKRGIRVIPDTSLNHTGTDSIYFDRYAKYHSNGAFEGGKVNPDSPYADWYRFDPTQPTPEKQYKGWVGVADLPELNKASQSFRDFAYRAPDSVMKTWLDRGAAGWRMDVAPWVPDDFWREWRSEIKHHKPDALTIAETWFDASKFFLGDTFDSTMNYIFRNTVIDYANGGDARKLYRNLELMREAYPPQAFYALMNLISSHDVPRALHLFGYTSETTDAAKIAEAKQRLLLAAFFQMVFPGAPAIYYGDEVGLTGGEDPFNRAPYPWADEGGKPDVALLHQFRELASLRRQHAVLRHGSLQAPLAADAHTLALIRHHHGETALTLMNNDVQPKQLTLHLPADAATTYRDALTGATVHATGGSLVLKVPALFGRVLLSH